jgi:hypothetical protein
VRVADSGGRVATQPLSIIIVAQLAITTTSLPDGTLGTAYSQTIAVTGGSGGNTWSISAGSLPAGLNISTQGNGNGLITGTPTTAGASSFTVRVADNGGRSATKDLAINVIAPPTIVTNALPQGVVNATYSATLDFTGGTVPNMWSVVSGSLPAGLNISTQTNGTGLISGMPTAAGTTNFTVRVVDSGGRSGTKDLSITISASLAITTNSLPLGVVNSPYTATVIAAGGSGGNSWAIVAGSGSLPTGLQISTAQGNGVISGTPTTAGTSSFTVRVTDSGGRTANQQLSITINASISVTTTSLPTGAVGRPYPPTQLGVAGGAGPYTWDIPSGSGSLPQGLTLSTQGTISGTPTTAGAASFTVRVTDSGSRTASQPLSIIVNDVLSIETTSPLPAATVGGLYSFQLQVRGGVGPYTWTTTPATVPPGMTFSAVGVLAGMPTTAGEFTFTATVSDSTAATASKSFQISVVSTAFGTLGFASTVPTAVNPTQQPEITLIVSTPTSQPIPGTLTLSFLSGGVGAADDPMVQFSTGSATSRTVSFTIPANSTAVTFPSKVTLITGTISGTVQMTADIQGGPTRVFVGSVTINSTIPQLTNISAVRVSQGLRVQITGYSPDRRVSNADFGIDVRTPSGTQRVNLSRDVNGDFDGWYRNAASVPFGSSFFYEQLFMVQGDVNTVDAVTVSLTNGEGKATSASVPFTN